MCHSSSCVDSLIALKASTEKFVDISDCTRLFVDTNGARSFTDIRQEKFYPILPVSQLEKFNRTQDVFWLRLEAENSSSTDTVWTNLHFGFWGNIDLFQTVYYPNGQKSFKGEKFSVKRSTFFLTLMPNEKKEIFIRIKNLTSLFSFKLAFFWEEVSQDTLNGKRKNYRFNYMIALTGFIFILSSVSIFSLIHFFQKRELTYLLYSIYLLSLICPQVIRWESAFGLDASLSQIVAGLYTPLSENPTVYLIFIFYTLFAKRFLNIHVTKPKVNQLVNIAAVLIGIYILVVLGLRQWGGVTELGSIAVRTSEFTLILAGIIFTILVYSKSRLFLYIIGGVLFLLTFNIVGIFFDSKVQFVDSIWGMPHLYFQLGTLGEIVFFSLGITYKYKLAEREKLESRQMQAELELKALKSQMNPHFIFNALNTIKSLIDSGNHDEATTYLVKFSKLLRRVLNYSDKKQVSLQEELELLELYLIMESLRFEQSFEYEIKINDIDIDDVVLPPLTLQPYVENAIWHGLLHKKDDRKLLVELLTNEDTIVCVIDDNGIGRKKSTYLKRNTSLKRRSFGMENVQNKLKINKMLTGLDIQVKVIDKVDEESNSLGTRIELIIPKK